MTASAPFIDSPTTFGTVAVRPGHVALACGDELPEALDPASGAVDRSGRTCG
jgi:hypothetical protein